MTDYRLTNDNAPDVSFTGELVAEASSKSHQGPSNTRWTEIDLYKTASGSKWIAHVTGRTRWQGERDRFAVHICATDTELIEALGHGSLAKEIYQMAGIDASIKVE